MSYRREVWGRTRHDWIHSITTHLRWHMTAIVLGSTIAAWLAFRWNEGRFAVDDWAFGVIGAVGSLLFYSLGVLVAIRARMPAKIYRELKATIARLEAEYKATHPEIDLADVTTATDGASLSLRNSGAAATLRIVMTFGEGAFQPPPGGGQFFAQWPDGKDQMLLPKGAALSLRVASLSRTAQFPPAWAINYFDSGELRTTRLYLLPGSAAKTAAVDLELLANPELPGGPIRRRIRFSGDACVAEPLGIYSALVQ